MKNIWILLLPFVLFCESGATNYYLSAAGNDNNSGISPSTAWQSITKLNATSFSPGDSIFFRSGDIFRGNMTLGNSVSNIVITSYGTGSKPIISGAQLLTGWTASGAYFKAPYTGTVTNFFVNGREQTLARYPNEHSYLTLDSGQTAFLYDASLASIPSNLITGSKICVHSSQWSWEKSTVIAFAGSKITFGSQMLKPIPKFGYFLYDNINHLDTAHEWKYDATAKSMYYVPEAGANPDAQTCEISIYQNGIEVGANVKNVVIKNIAFMHQANCGILVGNSTNQNITIENCTFSGQYNYGVNLKGRSCRISNSLFRDIDGMAVYINGTGSGAMVVDHNQFINIGITRANGIGGQLNGTALMCASDSNYIHHNTVDSTGYCGISADGAYNLVERNIIDHAMMIENDGAAIKGWGATTTKSIYKNNIIYNSDGNTEGTFQAGFITPAIYFDFNVNNCTIANNTVINHTKKGVFINSANINHTITGNVIYGGNFLLDFNGSNLAPNAVPITGMTVKHNTFFSKDNNSVIIRQVDYTNAFTTGVFDSNYYFQPYTANRYVYRIGATPPYMNFAEWQAKGNDKHTRSSFVSWTYPISYDTIFVNPTDNDVIINLGSTKYFDLDSTELCGEVKLPPFSSKILISTSIPCSTESAEEPLSPRIGLFPMPVTDAVRIVSSAEMALRSYEIFDAQGRSILMGIISSQDEKITTERLMPGFYTIILRGNRLYTSAMVK